MEGYKMNNALFEQKIGILTTIDKEIIITETFDTLKKQYIFTRSKLTEKDYENDIMFNATQYNYYNLTDEFVDFLWEKVKMYFLLNYNSEIQ